MKLYKILAIFAVVFGIIGGFIRYIQLKSGFDESTGLAIGYDRNRVILLVLTFIVIIVISFFTYFMRVPASRKTPTLFVRFSPATAMSYYFALLLFALAGVLQLIIALNNGALDKIIAALLMLFTAVSMLITGKMLQSGEMSSENGIFVLVPVFWACFWLIINFRSAAANPVIQSYIYDIFVFITLVLTLFNFAAILFNRQSIRKMYFASTLCLYFSLVSFIGEILNMDAAVTKVGDETVINGELVYLTLFLASICFSAFCLMRIFRSRQSLNNAKIFMETNLRSTPSPGAE